MLNIMALFRPQGWKKDIIKFGRPIYTLEANVPAFNNIQCLSILLVTWGQFATQKCSKLAPSFLALTPSVKRALDDINQTVIQAKREFENIQV
jgi:hypothetical protein